MQGRFVPPLCRNWQKRKILRIVAFLGIVNNSCAAAPLHLRSYVRQSFRRYALVAYGICSRVVSLAGCVVFVQPPKAADFARTLHVRRI